MIEGNTAELDALREAVLDLVAHPELNPDHEQLSNLLAATIAWVGRTRLLFRQMIARIARLAWHLT